MDDKVHLFASDDWSRENHVVMTHFDDHFKMGTITPVLKAAPRQKIFNTSVTACPQGFIMAYEVSEPGFVDFSIRFVISNDLFHWEPIGQVFHPESYAACPSIRYWNGNYYILYLRSVKTVKKFHTLRQYITGIARTRDFEKFEDFAGNAKLSPNTQVLSPDGAPSEGINNSDVDLVEYHGLTLFVYGDGDQKTWSNVRTAVYLGSMGKFFQEYWPDA